MKLPCTLILMMLSIAATARAAAQEYGQMSPPATQEECKDDPTLRPGQRCYKHLDNHPYYPSVFTTSNCQCTTGECRATEWRSDSRSPVGYAVKYEGKWCPIASYVDPRYVKIPPELRADPAHTCVVDSTPLDENGCPKRSCNIINNSS